MLGFTHWKSQALSGLAVIEAQRCWLSDLTDSLDYHLRHDGSRAALGDCLTQLLSGLLQSLPSEEEAFFQLGHPLDAAHLAEHNQLCLEVLELIKRHEYGEDVGAALLQCLRVWLGEHCASTDRAVLH